MNKERIKSIILVLLVIVNIILAEKILVNKKLWPSGYNFFNIGNTVKKNDYSVTGQLAVPEKIIVNTGYQSSRFEYPRNSKEFSNIFTVSNKILKKAFSEPARAVTYIEAESWYSVLTAKSVYLSYPCSYSSQNFANLLGISKTERTFESFKDIVISDNGNVYISEKDGSSFYKIDTASSEMSPIIEAVSEQHSDEESVINYSFDLNFDKDLGGQKTFLSPMIPIYSSPITADVITSSNPVLKGDEVNNKTISAILTAFSINPNTVRRYTEADGSLVFVENNGILKISPDGILSFTATDTGIRISSLTTFDTHSNVSSIASFVDKVNAASGIDLDMCITSPLTSQSESHFTFDYITNGLPLYFEGQNAISAKISNGYLTEYKQILRKYESLGYSKDSTIYIEALDNIIAKYQNSMNEIRIIKMVPSYIDNLTIGEKSVDWYIGIDNVVAQ